MEKKSIKKKHIWKENSYEEKKEYEDGIFFFFEIIDGKSGGIMVFDIEEEKGIILCKRRKSDSNKIRK